MRKSARGKNPIFPPPCHWGFVGGSHPVTGAPALPLPVSSDRPQATGASRTAFTSPCCGTKGQPTPPSPRTAQGPTGPRAGGGARAPLFAPGSVGRGVRRGGLARSPARGPARFYRPRQTRPQTRLRSPGAPAPAPRPPLPPLRRPPSWGAAPPRRAWLRPSHRLLATPPASRAACK